MGNPPSSTPTAAASPSPWPTTNGCWPSCRRSANCNSSRYRLLRGALDGQPGSWVRLTESKAGVEGAIWDGHDLYAVTTYARIADQLTTPLAASPDQTVIYKLSDMRDALPQDFCALEDDAVRANKLSPLAQYQHMVGELQAVGGRQGHAPDRNRAGGGQRLRGRGIRGPHRGHAGAAQHRRGHLQRAGGPAGAGHRRAHHGARRRSVHQHARGHAARADRPVPRATPRRCARAAWRT